MSEPTEYDLQQDQRIIPLEEILSQAAEPPTGDEFSYPVVGQGWSTSMWRWMTRGIGNGILYAGGRPYALGNVDNNSQTVQILVSSRTGTANAIIDGFFHELQANKSFTLPMPGSGSATYNIALTFDPRKESAAEGPISIEVYTGTPPTTFDRKHIVLHTVVRRANELLSDATFTEGRAGISPVINANSEADLPDPDTVLSGTMCVVSPLSAPAVWFARHYADPERNVWESLSDPGWRTQGLNSFYEPASGTSVQIQRKGKTRRLQGRVQRTDGRSFDTSWSEGLFVTTLSAGDRPPFSIRVPIAMAGWSPARTANLNISANGEVRVFPGGSATWVDLSAAVWDAE